jgi:GNAT superfamily N-acetyltransferase
MKVSLKIITSHNDVPISVVSLYLLAFVEDERRPCRRMFELIDDKGNNFNFVLIYCNQNLVGFVTMWNFDEFLYVEHFAIFSEMRGRGVGAAVLNILKHNQIKPLLLEAELPGASADAARRVEFYKRCGLEAHMEYRYLQPAYAPGRRAVELLLMTSGQVDLDSAHDTLYAKVYESC